MDCKKNKKLKLYNDVAFMRHLDGTKTLVTANEIGRTSASNVKKGNYLCPGVVKGKECLAPMILVHRQIPEDRWFFRCSGGVHINDCPYCSELRERRVQTLNVDPESIDFEKQLRKMQTLAEIEDKKRKKGDKQDDPENQGEPTEEEQLWERVIDIVINTIRSPQKLLDDYQILKNSRLQDCTADGYRVDQAIVDDRTFELYRKGRLTLDNHCIVIAGGGVYPGLSKEFLERMKHAIALKDPYMSLVVKSNIVYIIDFATEELYRYFIKQGRLRMNDKSLYLIIGKWHALKSEQRTGTKYYYCLIEKPGQITKLKPNDNLEDQEKLHKDFRMYVAE